MLKPLPNMKTNLFHLQEELRVLCGDNFGNSEDAFSGLVLRVLQPRVPDQRDGGLEEKPLLLTKYST